MADYTQDIIDILLHAPDGLPVRKIVRHVYNKHNTLFSSTPIEDIRRDVSATLLQSTRRHNSCLERAGRRGYYRISRNRVTELSLQFSEDVTEPDQTLARKTPDNDEPSLGLPFC
ncbi:MAG: hypothetical protein MSA31_09085 [Bacteroidales bacterium]|nr:hypothetical protein [Bacteroidales bacterium]MDD6494697.1 hypothetical protein [Bacteroidales bacterium]